MQKDLVTGLSLESSSAPDPVCEPCIAGKQTRARVPKTAHRYSEPLHCIYMDVHGHMPVQTPEGFRYWVLFVDDATRLWAMALMRHKSEAFTHFKQFVTWAETQTGKRVKIAHFDQGGEFTSGEFKAFCSERGIHLEYTQTAEPHQNGVVERPNRTLAEGVISMLQQANLPPSWWGRAAEAFVHVRNQCWTATTLTMTPYEAFLGRKPAVDDFRGFGCTAYVHVKEDKRSGLESHTRKCLFAGYPSQQTGWTFWHPETCKFFVSNSAICNAFGCPGASSACSGWSGPTHLVFLLAQLALFRLLSPSLRLMSFSCALVTLHLVQATLVVLGVSPETGGSLWPLGRTCPLSLSTLGMSHRLLILWMSLVTLRKGWSQLPLLRLATWRWMRLLSLPLLLWPSLMLSPALLQRQ